MKRGNLGKMLLVHPSYEYVKMYRDFGFVGTDDINDADVVAFTGGEDVSPELYGEITLQRTHCNRGRDDYEKRIFDAAVERKIPMVGICRGGQFLNVMNGGKMWQDVNHHGRNHMAKVNLEVCTWYKKSVAYSGSPDEIWVSSTHHQMMVPGEGAQILLTASESTERVSAGREQNGKVTFNAPLHQQDIEALWYPNTLSLCFQPHPEFQHCPPTGKTFFQQCLDNLILESMPLPEAIREILETGVKK